MMRLVTWVLSLLLSVPCVVMSADIDEPAPNFTLPNLKREEVQLFSLKGKVVYLDFWASWCTPCLKTFPWMNGIYKKYGADGLEIVAVNLDEKQAMAEQFLEKMPVDFQIVLDPKRKISKLYKVKGVPMSFLIDRNGIIRSRYLGTADEHFAVAEGEIKEVLKAGK